MYGIFCGKSIGSGTIIDKDGTILTCAHAVVDFQGRRISSKGKVSWEMWYFPEWGFMSMHHSSFTLLQRVGN